MPRVFVASVLVFGILVACAAEPAQDALAGTVRKVAVHIRIGDGPIHQGRIFWNDEVFQFRACDRGELYFVDAPISIHDTLDLVI